MSRVTVGKCFVSVVQQQKGGGLSQFSAHSCYNRNKTVSLNLKHIAGATEKKTVSLSFPNIVGATERRLLVSVQAHSWCNRKKMVSLSFPNIAGATEVRWLVPVSHA